MRFGSVSWVVPGGYAKNARILRAHVDFVELLVYTWDAETKSLLTKEADELKSLGCAYTVHLPTDGIERCAQAYEFFKETCFPIKHFTLHPLPGWRGFIAGREDVSLENLLPGGDAFENMTIDIGHLMAGRNGDEVLGAPELRRIDEIHVHGLRGVKDHEPFDDAAAEWLREMAVRHEILGKAMRREEQLINFEIYDLDGFLESLRRFKDAFSADRAR